MRTCFFPTAAGFVPTFNQSSFHNATAARTRLAVLNSISESTAVSTIGRAIRDGLLSRSTKRSVHDTGIENYFELFEHVNIMIPQYIETEVTYHSFRC